MRRNLAVLFYYFLSAAPIVFSKNAIVCHNYEESASGELPKCAEQIIISDDTNCECGEIQRQSDEIVSLNQQLTAQEQRLLAIEARQLTTSAFANEIESLNKQLTEQNTKLLAIEAQQLTSNAFAATIRDGYGMLNDGWVGLFNGYQYKLTASAQSYAVSRLACISYGGNLAVYGVQDMGNRRILKSAFHGSDFAVWIGLNDQDDEGKWKWEDSVLATELTALWNDNNKGGNKDCAEIDFGNLLSNPISCASTRIGLCEKTRPENSISNSQGEST